MPDVGLTHIALPVTDLDASIAFYATYARMEVVHRRRSRDGRHETAWLSDRTRPFAIVLSERDRLDPPLDPPLGPFAHLGVACASRAEVDRLVARAREEGCLASGPENSGPPVGYWVFLRDPDGHTLELSFGQEVAQAVGTAP
ncbi:MAG: VOC family protein [Planctomycetota bacterium]